LDTLRTFRDIRHVPQVHETAHPGPLAQTLRCACPCHPRSTRCWSISSAPAKAWFGLKYYSEYAFGMERVTATLDEQTLAKIRHVAGPRGVSSFLNEAAREHLARLELRGLLDELDAKHGAAPAAVRAEIARDARQVFRAR